MMVLVYLLFMVVQTKQGNYNPEANTDFGGALCVPFIDGCIDPAAFNYEPNANTDDGSCIDVVLGCTDSTALNYNEDANTDDVLVLQC